MSRRIGVMNMIYRRIAQVILVLTVLLVSNSNFIEVQAMEFEEENAMTLVFEEISSAVSMTSDLGTDGDLEIQLTSHSLESFLFLHQSKMYEWVDGAGIYVELENLDETDFYLNFNLSTEKVTDIQLVDSALVFMKTENDTEYNAFAVINGTITIPSGFKGALYIPFYSMSSETTGNTPTNSMIASIVSFGITVLTEMDVEQAIKLEALGVLTEDQAEIFPDVEGIRISGPSELTIPAMGESIGDYYVQEQEEKVSVIYEAMFEGEGISISEEGRLTLTSKAEDQKIEITMTTNDNIVMKQLVELDSEWMKEQVDDAGDPYYIISVDDYYELNEQVFFDKVLDEIDNNYNYVRYILLGIVVFGSVIIWLWRSNNKKVKNKK